jgi:hypothetical protein
VGLPKDIDDDMLYLAAIFAMAKRVNLIKAMMGTKIK